MSTFKEQQYVIGQVYKGKLLGMFNTKEERWISVDKDKRQLVIHKNNHDLDQEVPLDAIEHISANIEKGYLKKFYLQLALKSGGGDYKFKFSNVQDFYFVFESLRSHLHVDDAPHVDERDEKKNCCEPEVNDSSFDSSDLKEIKSLADVPRTSIKSSARI